MKKTTDGGANWVLTSTQFIIRDGLAIDPLTPSILFAGGQGPAGLGVYKTTDGATSWSFTGLNQLTHALAVDPVTPTTVYAGTDNGVFKTTDGGGSWTASSNGLASLPVLTVAVDPQATYNVFAATQGGGLYKSDDSGAHWTAAAGCPASMSSPSPSIRSRHRSSTRQRTGRVCSRAPTAGGPGAP